MESTEPTGNPGERLYAPAPGERQLTTRAVISGCLIGGIGGLMNVYMGLKIGFTVGGSLMTAILAFGFFSLLGSARRLSVLETNISQTAGMAASSMASAAGLIAPIPAMLMMGYDVPAAILFPWSLAVAYLGVFFAVPLRTQYLLVDKLPFPSGTATAHTILTMVARAGDAVSKARVLIYAGVGSAAFSLVAYFVPLIETPPLYELWAGPLLDVRIGELVLQGGLLVVLASWTISVCVSPTLIGSAFLIGPRAATSLLAGALLAWGLLGPLATAEGWVSGPPHDPATGAAGWILWPGAAIMIGDALFSLLLSYKTIVRAVWPSRGGAEPTEPSDAGDDPDQSVPRAWWMWGLAGGSALTCVIAYLVFDIPVWMTLLAIPLSAVLAAVATRAMGETDMNPTGPMGQVTQIVYGAISPGNVPTILMTGAITVAGAGQCADMLQDLKTGRLLGASPRKQLAAQLWGVTAGVFVVVPIFFLFARAYDIGGGDDLPAPSARIWKAVAELMNQGWDNLPAHADTAMFIALGVGVLLSIARTLAPRAAPYIPSGMALGIAFLVPALYSICIFAGAMLLVLWRRLRPENAAQYAFAVACGLIAGEGIMGVVKAVMTLAGVPTLTG